jgi:rubrerythrin
MKLSTLATLSLPVLAVYALPLARRADADVLNFALTLEHLENAFYTQALSEFDDEAFKKAGLPDFARGRFVELAANEAAHQELLTQILGDAATQPCTYKL